MKSTLDEHSPAETPGEALIQVRGLSKSFGSTVIWNDVNLDVYKGETLAVIGRSGCGKSVLLKHFNALLTPTSGDVW
jgi:ABC-type transport system involved in resistance to organic solvents, ATPase component